MKKRVIAGLLVGVLVVVGVVGWRASENEDSDVVVLYGNVDIRQVSLAFDGSGRVLELRAEEGDRVKTGQVLGVIDTDTLQLQAEQAQARIEVQQQTLARLNSGSRPEEIAQARSRLAAAEADAERADQFLARLQDLATTTQGRGVSAQDLDQARTGAMVAEARVREQREALRLAEIGPRAEDVAAAEAELKAQQAQLALLRHQIAQGELRAPADAVVRTRLLEPGDMATPQRAVFALALTQPKWIRVYLSETDLGRVRPGMAAQIVTDSFPDQPVAGQVGYISSVAEFTPKSVQTEDLRTSLVYEMRVVTQDEDDQLRLGQPVTVYLGAGAAR